MSESVIADFVARFHAPNTPPKEPVRGRIVCSPRRLVLAADSETQLQIPLTAVVDIGVGTVPPDLAEFFDSTVTIAFERNGHTHVAAVEAGTDYIRKFATVLFTAILEGSPVIVRHPDRIDGRLTGESFQSLRAGIERDAVILKRDDHRLRLPLEDVTGLGRGQAEVQGDREPVLEVDWQVDDRVVATLIGGPSPRKLSLFGRYLRVEYADAVAEVRGLDLDEPEQWALIVRYVAADDPNVSVESVLDLEAHRVDVINDRLAEHGLIPESARPGALTRRGLIAAELLAGEPG